MEDSVATEPTEGLPEQEGKYFLLTYDDEKIRGCSSKTDDFFNISKYLSS